MTDFVERRNDTHTKMLVEVGIRLFRFRDQAYAREFLNEVHVPACIIERVLAEAALQTAERRVRHVSYTTADTV
jgi:hypothetical protein